MKRPLLALPLAAALIAALFFLGRRTPAPPSAAPASAERREGASSSAPEAPRHAPPPARGAATSALLLRVTGRGTPLPDAQVTLTREDAAGQMKFQTGPDGTRLILQIPSGHYLAAVRHPRFIGGETHVDLEPGTQATAVLDLQRGARVFGRVSDLAGAPLAETNVQLVDDETQGGAGAHLSAKTDAEGRFEIGPVPTGDWGLRLRHVRFKPREHHGLSVRTGAEELEVNVALEVGSKISGRVLDEQGLPLAGARVIFGNEGGGGLGVSDAQGRYTVFGLTEAAVHGSATLKGYGTDYRRNVPANAGDVDFRLSRGATLTGRLLADPLPEHYTIALSRFAPELGRPQRIHQEGFSTAQIGGAFRIEDLAPGTYWVEVECDGYVPTDVPQVTLGAGQTGAGVTLRIQRK